MQHDETITAAEYTYTVLLQPEPEGGYTVTCPALPGLVTYGETLEEARSMAADAIRGISNACVRTASRSPRAIPAIMEEVSRVLAGEQKIGSEMRLASRNESMGFAKRTRKNLQHIEKAFDAGHDVHVVTQIVNSLLGLAVFLWENHLNEVVKATSLAELERQGWPRWKITKGSSATLGS